MWTSISALLCDDLPSHIKAHWLRLRRIVLNLAASSISYNNVSVLYSELREWMIDYQELHGLECGKPKTHYAFHMVASILLWGPSSLSWCFKHEGKLGHFSKVAANRNGKNVHVWSSFFKYLVLAYFDK